MLNNENYKYSVEDARDTLNRIIGFVNNCDTKASIILGVFGVITTVIISNSLLNNIHSIFTVIISANSLLGYLYLIALSFSIILFFLGVANIFFSLIAKISPSKKDSTTFFADIASNKDLNIFKDKVINQNEISILDDLLNQIYINSLICTKKYKHYNKGIKLSLIGFVLFIVTYFLGIVLF